MLTVTNLAKRFGEKRLFSDVSFQIKRNERVFVLGMNGCGKTTLFKILLNKIRADSGRIEYGVNVDTGYFDQVQENLNLENNALDEIWNMFPFMTQTEVRTALGSFLFKGDDVFKPLSSMSGGERARIALLKLMLEGDNFLLLDEPTNHLDTLSREELENTLQNYEGTLLIISHDRYFINKLADRILYLDKDGITEYVGDYQYYLEKSSQKNIAKAVSPKSENEKSKNNDYQLRKEQQSNIRKMKTKIRKCEEEMERLDILEEDLQKALESPENVNDFEKLMSLTTQLQECQQNKEKVYEEWEAFQIKLEEMENDVS